MANETQTKNVAGLLMKTADFLLRDNDLPDTVSLVDIEASSAALSRKLIELSDLLAQIAVLVGKPSDVRSVGSLTMRERKEIDQLNERARNVLVDAFLINAPLEKEADNGKRNDAEPCRS